MGLMIGMIKAIYTMRIFMLRMDTQIQKVFTNILTKLNQDEATILMEHIREPHLRTPVILIMK